MDENYAIKRFEQAAKLLPARWQHAALCLPDCQKEQAEELRLRIGQGMTILLPDGESPVYGGNLQAPVTRQDLDQLCDAVTDYSLYTAAETLRAGYLTAPGGFRIGLCGTAVMQDGYCMNLRDFSSASIRISREWMGISSMLLPQLIEESRFCSTLIISPPGLGKTTLLRDLIRYLSDGTETTPLFRVAVADERGEIASVYQGKPQMAIGCHTDIMDGCPKAKAIPMLLRAMNPQIIAVDEITVQQDIEAINWVANCGVSLLASVHAAGSEELRRKPMFSQLLDLCVFTRCITITVREGKRYYEVQKL